MIKWVPSIFPICMKKITPLSVVALVLLSACAPAASNGTSDSSAISSTDHSIMDTNHSDSSHDSSAAATSSEEEAASSAAASAAVTAGARIITMSVEDFVFSPNTITVKKGEKVVVRLTAKSGTHGFGSTDLGLNVRIEPGETKDIVIPTDRAGTFTFKCSVPCGSGHRDMTGTIIVEE